MIPSYIIWMYVSLIKLKLEIGYVFSMKREYFVIRDQLSVADKNNISLAHCIHIHVQVQMEPCTL
jgi:DNA phosphorothioation-dependent restriction protein DptG